MKKIFNYLIVFAVVFTTVVIFTPLSLFEDTINQYLKQNFADISIRLKGIDYKLASFSLFEVDKVSLSYQGQACQLDNLSLRVSPSRSRSNLITIESLKLGKVNCELEEKFSESEKLEQKKEIRESSFPVQEIKFNSIYIRSLNLSYKDFRLKKGEIKLTNISLKDFQNLKLSLKFYLNIEKLIKEKKIYQSINIEGSYTHPQFEVSKITIEKPQLSVKDIKLSFGLKANMSGKFNIDQIIISDWLSKVSSYQLTGGNLIGAVSFQDLDFKENKVDSLSTELKIFDLTLKGVDIDKLLKNYIESNENSYLDIAGFLTLGPVGLLVSKTTKLSKSIPGIDSGTTEINKAILKTNLSKNIVRLDEVGVKTKDHRLVLKGDININSKKLKLKFAPVNKEGCPIFLQKVGGTVNKPDIGAMKTFAGNLFSPITDIFKKSKEAISKCDQFYNGSFL